MMDATTRTAFRFQVTPLTKIVLDGAPEFIIPGLLPATGLTTLYGPPGSGKSFLGLHMSLCMAGGLPFFGLPVQQCGVAYIAAEAGAGFKKRVIAARQALGIDRGAPFWLVPVAPDFSGKSKDFEALASEFRHLSVTAKTIVIDTTSRTMGGADENKVADMSAWLSNVDKLLHMIGLNGVTLAIHHTGKDITKGMRGSSSLHGATDAEILVTKEEGGLHVATVQKMRDAEDDLTFSFRLERAVATSNGTTAETCVVVPVTMPSKASPKTQQANAPTGQAALALRFLHEALHDVGQVPPASNHIPNNTRTVTLDQWREYCRRRGLAENDDPETFRKAFRRAKDSLLERRLVSIWTNQVWFSGAPNVPVNGV